MQRAQAKTLGQRISLYFAKNGVYWLMALPGLVLLFLFAYAPLPGILIAFKNYKFNLGIWGSDWLGLKNFEFLVRTPLATRALLNTLLMNGLFIVTGTLASLFLALLMNEIQHKLRARFFQSAMFFPYFLSAVIVSYLVFALLSSENGLINRLLISQSIEPVSWYSEAQYWPTILMLVNLWKGAGFGSILYLAGMLGISTEYYEAAKMDGANKLQQIVFITLPLLSPIIVIQVLLAIGRIFYADFGLFYIVTKDAAPLRSATEVIDTYVYRALLKLGDVGMAAAAGFAQSVVGFVLVFLSNFIVRKVDAEKSLF
jgi:putative aldouronate transport system permease protein